jgi:hypothetical protein
MSNPNSSLNRSLELVIFFLARLTADNLRQNSAKASTVLQEHAHRLFATCFSFLSKLHWLTQRVNLQTAGLRQGQYQEHSEPEGRDERITSAIANLQCP